MKGTRVAFLVVALAAVAASAALADLGPYEAWSPAIRVEGSETSESSFNGPYLDGCPFISRDGKEFFMASRRPTSPADQKPDINTTANEASPFPLPQADIGPVLYFSSTISGNGDLYSSTWHSGDFQGRDEVPGVNTPSWNEGQPNVRRDGLELFYFSNQPDGVGGGNDIYSATRPSTAAAFSGAADLGPNVNSAASETRPSLAWDGTRLYFGSNRPGGDGDSDHYVTTRDPLARG